MVINKLKTLANKAFDKDDKAVVVNTNGDAIDYMYYFKGKLILSETAKVGDCAQCGGPIFKDTVTSFDYVCPNENINKIKSNIIFKKK